MSGETFEGMSRENVHGETSSGECSGDVQGKRPWECPWKNVQRECPSEENV